ncbi:MAG: hypothetical protein AB7O73_13385, partial [Bacteroidia bacterium]
EVEKRAGLQIKYSKDCVVLAAIINEKCRTQISATTLKRIFGMVNGTSSVRKSTLDILALYLDYENWDDLVRFLFHIEIGSQGITELKMKDVLHNDAFHIAFGPASYIILKCQSSGKFSVIDEANTSVEVGDEVTITNVNLHHPLLLKKVIRNGITMQNIILGEVSGVTEIKPIKQSKKINQYGTI